MSAVRYTLKVSNQEKRSYQKWQAEGDTDSLNTVCQSYWIRSNFKFLGPYYDQLIETQKFELLPFPYFSVEGEDFKGVVEKLAGKSFTKGLVKKFGEATRKYGVNFLNNVWELNLVYHKSPLNFDQVVNLNHSKVLPRGIHREARGLELVLNFYTPQRILTLLSTANDEFLKDTVLMARKFQSLTREELKEVLPKKPSHFRDVHNAFSRSLLKEESPNVPLKQDLRFLHGLRLGEYVIEVPADSHDLISTAIELQHCVHCYAERIKAKECQIINLMKKHNRHYTVELVPSFKRYNIVQFKGFKNEDSMEGPEGRLYREELLKMIKDHRELKGIA